MLSAYKRHKHLALLIIFFTLINFVTNDKNQKSESKSKIGATLHNKPSFIIPSILSTYPYNTYSYFNFAANGSPYKCGGYMNAAYLPGKKCEMIYKETLKQSGISDL